MGKRQRVIAEARRAKAYAAGPQSRRNWIRREVLLDLSRDAITPLVARDHDGLRFILDTSDRSEITRSIWENGYYEADLMEQVLAAIKSHGAGSGRLDGKTFLDIGSNIGTASMTAMHRFGAERAVAIEPHPANLRMLRMNLAANDMWDRVDVLQAAVSDRPGTVVLEESGENIGDHRVRAGSGDDATRARTTIDVEAITLDEALERTGLELTDIGLVWIDVQGHEAQVMAGATRLVAAAPPVLMEYWPYGLKNAGGLDELNETIAGGWSKILEIGDHQSAAEATPVDGIAGLERIVARIPGEPDFTNLLLLP